MYPKKKDASLTFSLDCFLRSTERWKIKTAVMKISNLVLGTLLVASTAATAQEKKPLKEVKKDSVKVIKRTNQVGHPVKTYITPPDSLNKTKTDSSTIKPIKHGPDYCPPCGMG